MRIHTIYISVITAGYSASLPWTTRVKIALEAAKGLAFLHEEENPVIFRDFKASNILLDSVMAMAIPLWSLSIGHHEQYH